MSLSLWGIPMRFINREAAVLSAALIGLPPATALRSLSSVSQRPNDYVHRARAVPLVIKDSTTARAPVR